MEWTAIDRPENWRNHEAPCSDSDVLDLQTDQEQPLPVLSQETASDAIDNSFDCVSPYSDNSAYESVERLRNLLAGSPENILEGSSAFSSPEIYSMEVELGSAINVVAVKEVECTSTYRCQKYLLLYAKTPRAWRRVTIAAIIFTANQKPIFSEVAAFGALSPIIRILSAGL